METKKSASKTSSRAKLNSSIDVFGLAKKVTQSGTKSAKKVSTKSSSKKSSKTTGTKTSATKNNTVSGTALKTAVSSVVAGAVATSVGAKKSPKSLIIIILCLILGVLIGAFGVYTLVSKNDCFEIIGGDELTYTLDDAYIEQGVKIIEFNKDISSDVKIETNLQLDENNKSTEIGTFYVKYTIDSVKYGKIFKIEKIRLVTFVENSEGGE